MSIKLCENIKRLREEKGITQSELAEKLSVTPQSVSRWEKGLAYPDIEKLPQLAILFGVSIDSLMGTIEPRLYSISREINKVRRELHEENTSENMLKYLELLEQSINAGSTLYLSEYIRASTKVMNDGRFILKEKADSAYETVRNKLIEMLPDERRRHLVPIIINEDEDKLERWSDLVSHDNNFACWNDLLLQRYIQKRDVETFCEKRREIIFDDLSKILYLINQKSGVFIGGLFDEEFESIENCNLVKDIIDVCSKRDDDVFLFHRINAETRLLASNLALKNMDSVYNCIARIKELLGVCKQNDGKTLSGSVEMFSDYQLHVDRARVDRALFEIDNILMTDPFVEMKENDQELKELDSYIQQFHSETDPFYFVENRLSFERLYNRAERLLKTSKIRSMSYIMAVETSKGNIYELVSPNVFEECEEEKRFLNTLRIHSDTHIKYLVGFICDVNKQICIDLPSLHIRETLCDLDKRNLDTEILLRSHHSFNVKKNRVTISPATHLKYSEEN